MCVYCKGGISRPASISTGRVYYLHFEHIAQEKYSPFLSVSFWQHRIASESPPVSRKPSVIVIETQRTHHFPASKTPESNSQRTGSQVHESHLRSTSFPHPTVTVTGTRWTYGFTGFESHRPEPLHPASSASLNPISLAQRSQEPGTSITRQRHLSSDFKCLGFPAYERTVAVIQSPTPGSDRCHHRVTLHGQVSEGQHRATSSPDLRNVTPKSPLPQRSCTCITTTYLTTDTGRLAVTLILCSFNLLISARSRSIFRISVTTPPQVN